MAEKLVYVVDRAALDNGQKTQAAVLVNGALSLMFVRRDKDGVIRRVINTSNKTPYTKVNMYVNSATALNLTEKETKEVMQKGLITIYRSSGAVNEKGEPLTREEQIVKGLARKIEVTAELINEKEPTNPLSYRASIYSDSGASEKLEGEYTL